MIKLKILLIALLLISSMCVVILGNNVEASEFKLSWTTKASMPTPRGQAATVVGNDGKIYVIGGKNESYFFNSTEVYDPSTNSWTTKAPIINDGIYGAAAVKGVDGLIYVIGGYSADSLSSVYAYNSTSNMWTEKTSIPTGVWTPGAVTGNDGRIYVIGGEESGGVESKRLQIYNVTSDTWTTGPSMPTARSELKVVKDANGFIYAIGGYSGSSATDVVEVYDPYSNMWSTRKSMPQARLQFGATLGADGKIYVIGGGTSYFNNASPFFGLVMVYDPLADSWSYEANMPTARRELIAVSIGNSIYTIGGCNGTYLDTVEKADIAMPNTPPTAYIDSITPNPIVTGENITFTGHGTDSDGSIVAYEWRSSIDGVIGNTATFKTSTLSKGTHTIYFRVKDNSGAWSNEAVATVTVNVPTTEDPLYQSLNSLISQLQQQNSDLTDTVNGLTQKLDIMTYALLGAIIVAIVLGIATIALMVRKKTPPPPKPPTQ